MGLCPETWFPSSGWEGDPDLSTEANAPSDKRGFFQPTRRVDNSCKWTVSSVRHTSINQNFKNPILFQFTAISLLFSQVSSSTAVMLLHNKHPKHFILSNMELLQVSWPGVVVAGWFCWSWLAPSTCRLFRWRSADLGWPRDGTLPCLTHLSPSSGTQRLYKVCPLTVVKWKWKSYTVPGILQARILEWVAFLFSRGSRQPRDGTQVSCIAGRLCTVVAEA